MRLVEMSISAGVLIVLLTLLRKGRFWNLPKRTVLLLWMVVLARLLLPGSLPMRRGIAAPVHVLLQRVCSMHTHMAGQIAAARIVSEAASSGMADPMKTGLAEAAGLVWMAGMTGVFLYFAYCYRKEHRLLAQALPLESMLSCAGVHEPDGDLSSVGIQQEPEEKLSSAGIPPSAGVWLMEAYQAALRLAGIRRKKAVQILVHDRIVSPLVFGTVRQRIVIPKRMLLMEQSQMQYILIHEMVHIRRHDNLWKLLSAAAVCVHWFNPAVWLMYALFARDLELSCDEQVLSLHGSRGRQEYALTLLTLAQNQKGTALFCSGFLENPVKERIVAIMKYKKLTGIGILCAGMLFAGATSVFATNEQTGQAQDGGTQAQETEKKTEEKMQNAGQKVQHADDISYSIVSCEDGKSVIEKSGSGKAKKGKNDEIILVTFDQAVNADDIQENAELAEVQDPNELEADGVYFYEADQELKEGKTYKYYVDRKVMEEISADGDDQGTVPCEITFVSDDDVEVDELRDFEIPESAEKPELKVDDSNF